jgi:hypothetical protein
MIVRLVGSSSTTTIALTGLLSLRRKIPDPLSGVKAFAE